MYSTEDFSELDKSKFKCYKFPNGNIYYGEVAYMNKDNKIAEDIKEMTDEARKELKLVRHGNGVQLYDVNDMKSDCKYEGSWGFDKKNGRGVAHFIDGSTYEGDFINDVFEGIGKFIWKVGHVYIGSWKQGRMEGEGEFKHQDGHIMRGTFTNNYMFDKDRQIFLNPFLSAQDSSLFKEKNTQFTTILNSSRVKFSLDNIRIVYGKDEVISLMEDAIQNNYTPLLLRTIERMVDKQEIFSSLPYEHIELDLRYYYLKIRQYQLDSNEAKAVYEEIKQKTLDAMTNGKFLILNFDDCQLPFEELFDPDMKELYSDFRLNPLMWQPQIFALKENFNEHVRNHKELKLSPNFRFIVYSKFLISQIDSKENELFSTIESRFKKSLPLKYIKVFILSKPKPVSEQKDDNAAVAE